MSKVAWSSEQSLPTPIIISKHFNQKFVSTILTYSSH